MTDYAGIDYSGPNSQVNRDAASGIRYGVICVNDLEIDWDFDTESVYSPHCPWCGEELGEEEYGSICDPVACPYCGDKIGDGDQYGDDPDSTLLTGDYEGFIDSHNDAMLTKSPYFTYAQFCSPCAPGAGHLGNPCPTGPKTFCFGHEMFPNNEAPYPVYSVETGEIAKE